MIGGDGGLDRYILSQAPPQHLGKTTNEIPGIDDLGTERLTACKGEQPLRQRGATFDRPQGWNREFPRLAVGVEPQFEEADIAMNYGQQIVKVVRESSRKLSDCLHLLSLS